MSWESLDRGQVGVALGCSRAMVAVRLHRARRRFAAELAEEGIWPQSVRVRGHESVGRAITRPGPEEIR